LTVALSAWEDDLRKLNIDKYQKMLMEERDRLNKEIEIIEKSISSDEAENGRSELADYDQHEADAGTDTFMKERDLSVLDSWREVRGKIDEALGKIQRGTYGECDRCGREISEARLNAVPHALFCVECQEIVEGS